MIAAANASATAELHIRLFTDSGLRAPGGASLASASNLRPTWEGASHREHDLAEVLVRFHGAVRLSSLRERQTAVDRHRDRAVGDERQDGVGEGARRGHLFLEGAVAQRRAG